MVKHIAIITTSYPISRDGSEAAGIFVFDFVEKLSKIAKVTVVAPGHNTDIESIHDTLKIHRFYSPRIPLSLLRVSNPIHWYAIYQILKGGLKVTENIAREETLDHILALWVLPSGYWAYKIGKRFKIPYSTWALGSDIWNLSKIPIVKSVLKIVLSNSFLNFADGYQLKDDVEKISEKECLFLPSTRRLHLNTKKILSSSPPYRLVFLGRWHRNKGIDLFLEGLELLQNNTWKLIKDIRIFGGGPLKKSVEKSVNALVQQRRPITMGGYLNTDEAVDLLLSADYLMIPSRIESIPVIFSDGMKCSCPVVAMPVGDLPQLIKEFQCGLCAKEVNALAFSVALEAIFSFPPDTFSEGMIKARKSFNIDDVADKIYRSLL